MSLDRFAETTLVHSPVPQKGDNIFFSHSNDSAVLSGNLSLSTQGKREASLFQPIYDENNLYRGFQLVTTMQVSAENAANVALETCQLFSKQSENKLEEMSEIVSAVANEAKQLHSNSTLAATMVKWNGQSYVCDIANVGDGMIIIIDGLTDTVCKIVPAMKHKYPLVVQGMTIDQNKENQDCLLVHMTDIHENDIIIHMSSSAWEKFGREEKRVTGGYISIGLKHEVVESVVNIPGTLLSQVSVAKIVHDIYAGIAATSASDHQNFTVSVARVPDRRKELIRQMLRSPSDSLKILAELIKSDFNYHDEAKGIVESFSAESIIPKKGCTPATYGVAKKPAYDKKQLSFVKVMLYLISIDHVKEDLEKYKPVIDKLFQFYENRKKNKAQKEFLKHFTFIAFTDEERKAIFDILKSEVPGANSITIPERLRPKLTADMLSKSLFKVVEAEIKWPDEIKDDKAEHTKYGINLVPLLNAAANKSDRATVLVDELSKMGSLQERNNVYCLFHELMNQHDNPKQDWFFQVKKTDTFQNAKAQICYDAMIALHQQVSVAFDHNYKLDLLNLALTLEIFIEHRNNHVYEGAFWRTKAKKQIEIWLDEVKQNDAISEMRYKNPSKVKKQEENKEDDAEKNALSDPYGMEQQRNSM